MYAKRATVNEIRCGIKIGGAFDGIGPYPCLERRGYFIKDKMPPGGGNGLQFTGAVGRGIRFGERNR